MTSQTYSPRPLFPLAAAFVILLSSGCATSEQKVPTPAAAPTTFPTQTSVAQLYPTDTTMVVNTPGVPFDIPTHPVTPGPPLPVPSVFGSPMPTRPPLPTATATVPPITFAATITLVHPAPPQAFRGEVLQTGIDPVATTLQGTDENGSTVTVTMPGGWSKAVVNQVVPGVPSPTPGELTTEVMTGRINGHTLRNLVVTQADVRLDEQAFEKVKDSYLLTINVGPDSKPLAGAEAIVQRWKMSFGAVRTLQGSESFAVVNTDGSRQPISTASPANTGWPISTDEAFDMSGLSFYGGDQSKFRYRYAAHFPQGDYITLYDGKTSYRYTSWLNEVHIPLPESYAPNAYWGDDTDDRAMFNFMYPAPVAYQLVGTTRADGHDLIELVVPQSKDRAEFGPNGMSGTHVFLDADTYLPYKYVIYSVGSTKPTAYERTFNNLQVNSKLTAADFALQLPLGTKTVYESAYMAPRIQVYDSLGTAAKAAQDDGFALFAPQSGTYGVLYGTFPQGQASGPLIAISMNDGAIQQGAQLSISCVVDGMPPTSPPPVVSTISIDGQTASLCMGGYGNVLALKKESTIIHISGFKTQDEAVAIVRSLQRVQPK